MAKKPTTRDIKNELTRKKILQSANELFKKYPYDDVSIKDICDKANVSVGSFYHHFPEKGYLVELFYNEFDSKVLSVSSDLEELDSYAALMRLVTIEMEYMSGNITYSSQICRMQLSSNSSFIDTDDRPYYQSLKAITRRLLNDYHIQFMSEDLFYKMMLRFCRGIIYDWSLHQGAYDLTDAALLDIKLVLKGIGIKDD